MGNGWDNDVQRELNSAVGGFYQPHKNLKAGEQEEITVVRYAKHTDTKYPIKDKEGTSLGYTWRFWLADGRVWDVSNRNRKVLLQGVHPGGGHTVVPGRFQVLNHGARVGKAPALEVSFLGPATTPTGSGTPSEDVSF